MSKAEKDFEMMKKARKCLPDGGYSKRELNLAFYMFNKGYHQAEKDNELTWEDIKAIEKLLGFDNIIESPKEFYQEVLKRFKSNER